MKEVLTSYALYHQWANRLLTDTIALVDDERRRHPLVSSFAGLQATVLHLWDAESIWWQRMKLQEHVTIPSQSFAEAGFQEIAAGLQQQDAQWAQWLQAASEAQLVHVFAYHNSKKEYFKQPVWEMVLHVFNHGTYHRGQLVTLLRQSGVTKIPSTDYIQWTRKK